MRGLCPNSKIDSHLIPYNLENDGQTVFYGIYRSIVAYDDINGRWNLTVVGVKEKTFAFTDASKSSFLLGSNVWKIANDSKNCNNGKPYEAVLKLTGCREDQFTCQDGQCISMNKRCDQVSNCRDKTDEQNCKLVVVETGYNKKVAPFTVDLVTEEMSPARIDVSIDLLDVIEISEQNHKISFKFGISLGWYDHRVVYHKLKAEMGFNTLNDEEMGNVWIPYLIYDNTDNNEAVVISEAIQTVMAISREGNFNRSRMDVPDEIEIFSGQDNKISMNQTYSKTFKCTYLIHWFPFDTQV